MKKSLMPDGYFIILLALAVLFHLKFPILKIIFFPYNLVGIVLIIIGIAMTLLVNSLLLKSHTTIKPYETPRYFVTSGLFRLSRNPLYLGMAITFFGVNIFLGSLSPFIFLIIFIFVIDRLFIPIEEKNLEKKFGKTYIDYKREVRRWI
jgi:protein-S-isoprenylcysteine O-methyltransferase Ste14